MEAGVESPGVDQAGLVGSYSNAGCLELTSLFLLVNSLNSVQLKEV